MKVAVFTFSLLLPFLMIAQEVQIMDGLPEDLDTEKIIFFKFEPIQVTADENGKSQARYIHLRQTNHNKVIKEANRELTVAAMGYPNRYAITTKSRHKPLLNAGYKYILDSRVYDNEHLKGQPNEGELIVFEYYIVDTENLLAYKVFQLDEMKVYDSKMLIRRLNKALKRSDFY
ncbi:MAG: hypothetical protein RIC95_15175 [Vicingaceae bacterium]